jgi:hypothetical protein
VPKDREDRHQRVSTQLGSSVSGFPIPVARRLAALEPEIKTGYSSQVTSSKHSTDLLLQQLMAEMKYLRVSVDTLPTGPVQGVAASLQTPQEIPEPSSQSLSSQEEMEVIEQTTLPYPQAAVTAQPLEISTSAANLQVYEMAYFCALIRKHVTTEFCPPTTGEPLLEPSQIYVIWCSGSAMAGRPSSFNQGFSGTPTFSVRH